MEKKKTSQAQIKAVRNWEKTNIYKKTITFYKNDFPEEKFEIVKKKLQKMGISQNEFFAKKLKELIGDE